MYSECNPLIVIGTCAGIIVGGGSIAILAGIVYSISSHEDIDTKL